MDDLVSGYF